MSAKLNAKLSGKSKVKSLACWLLIAASCPQVLAIVPIQAQNQVSANQSNVVAVASRITDINASVTGDRLNLTLNFASSDRPQFTYSRQGKAWVALLNGAQLQLGNGNASYARANPMPGITSIEATQYAANKVKIRVNTTDPEVLKELIKRQDTPEGLVLSLETQPSAVQNSSISSTNAPETGVIPSQQNATETSKVLTAQNTTSPSSVGKPLFEPKITITSPDGKTRVAQSNETNTAPPPVANPVTPQLPGRVPGVVPPFRQLKTPPVGDIATSTAKLRPDIVDLGTAERVPRITLREAPAIEVLTLIGRVAGLSVVSAETPAAGGAAPAAGATTGLKQPVSLSIENETAQDVFNNVLRITGLEANRIGQTIFVGTKLPVTLKNLVTKSYRLNQITVGEASAYLIGLGASRVVTRQRPIPGVQTAQIGTASQAIVNIPTESVPTLETVAITPESGASPLLKGLQVIAEERGNSLTLIGSPKQVEFAEAQLARLDIRKRQVVINVRVVEINLNSGTALPNQTVTGNIDFTGGNPTITQTAGNVLGLSLTSAAPITLPTSLLATITASVTSGQGKVLTDPSLTVQEGESASISLTEKVVTENTINITAPTGGSTVPTRTQTIKTEDVGLSLNISLARVDDNGFINLSISPAVTAIIGQTNLGTGELAGSFASILSKRTLNSGQIRLRDGQTLILSGIIRDSERQATSKVPILGDIPILGALFRSEATTSNRSEVVIVVTPRVIDDSQNANWGYTYQPGPETQKVIDSNQRKSQ
ncbi:MAG: AMIN domain-containing protein [Pseudanabaena sp. M090S1SP1A06QC]|jgi:type IV pilus assembly protein PilQ|nr:AMIN domain-containing protein [Pseudanabaena sp. M051S1SP1A06QC]MCA6590249.1 AMIN domain-containing protein [Pseudanabaena sp. M109S1SP1A06QC]MCA6606278.1 AMIN domain-containing protein [Pseudanabaena sp. M007S1SP1A06QC]MCA6615925.1 AMIN domain-containing protein [Pseudanabaena sp. M090S1SP1A06QC]